MSAKRKPILTGREEKGASCENKYSFNTRLYCDSRFVDLFQNTIAILRSFENRIW